MLGGAAPFRLALALASLSHLEAAVVNIEANITQNTLWVSTNTYHVNVPIQVQNGAILTIQPGTVIKGRNEGEFPFTKAGAIYITPGSKIMAEGTKDSPITFTTQEEVTASSRIYRQWGGLFIMGKAPVKGGTFRHSRVPDVSFGGSNPLDNSGVLKYVRFRHGGASVEDSQSSAPSLFLGSVGNGTTVENVEVAYGRFTGLVVFGGNVNLKHVSCIASNVAQLYINGGYQGYMQYVFLLNSVSTLALGIYNFHEKSTEVRPRTHPRISHMTIIEDERAGAPCDDTCVAIEVNGGPGGDIRNSLIFTDSPRSPISFARCSTTVSFHTREELRPADEASYPDTLNLVNNFASGYTRAETGDIGAAQFLDQGCVAKFSPNSGDIFTRQFAKLKRLPIKNFESHFDISFFDPRPADVIPSYQKPVEGIGIFENPRFTGAFDYDILWLDGWSILSEEGRIPRTVGVQTVSQNIEQDTTWTNDRVYYINDAIQVTNGAVLTIQPGTLIKSIERADNYKPGAVYINPGSKLFALGTRDSPITFTTQNILFEGTDELQNGHWGGLFVMGLAPVKEDQIRSPQAPDVEFGGSNPTDNSGVIQFVRILYAGAKHPGIPTATPIIDSRTHPAFFLGGVGSGTVVEYVESSYSRHFGIYVSGGTVNLRFLSTVFSKRGLKLNAGYQGSVQYFFSLGGNKVSKSLDIGNGRVNVNDTEQSPDYGLRTHARVSHVTILNYGAELDLECQDEEDYSACASVSLFLGAAGELRNFLILLDKDDKRLVIQHSGCGTEVLANNALSPDFTNPDFLVVSSTSVLTSGGLSPPYISPLCKRNWSDAIASNPELMVSTQLPQLRQPMDGADPMSHLELTNLDPRPTDVAASPGASEVLSDPFFEPQSFIGAFHPDYLWLEGWSLLSEDRVVPSTVVQVPTPLPTMPPVDPKVTVSSEKEEPSTGMIAGAIIGGILGIIIIVMGIWLLCFRVKDEDKKKELQLHQPVDMEKHDIHCIGAAGGNGTIVNTAFDTQGAVHNKSTLTEMSANTSKYVLALQSDNYRRSLRQRVGSSYDVRTQASTDIKTASNDIKTASTDSPHDFASNVAALSAEGDSSRVSQASYEGVGIISALGARDFALISVSKLQTEFKSIYMAKDAWDRAKLISEMRVSRDDFLEAAIGRGSFGSVYLVQNTEDQQLYAVKVISLSRVCVTHQMPKEKIKLEAQQHATMRHKNIVSYKFCWERAGMFYMVMEYCRTTLLKMLDVLSIDDAVKYTHEIAEGLAYLHHRNITHRDIKADNILIGANGEARLGDLGLSTRTGCENELETSALATLERKPGHIVYRAPENMCVGGSVDIWALGLVACEMVVGKTIAKFSKEMRKRGPFAAYVDEKLIQGLKNTVQHKSRILHPIVEGCLEYNPLKRLTAQQVEEQLKARENKSLADISTNIQGEIRRESARIRREMSDMKDGLQQLVINMTLNPHVRSIPTYVLITPKLKQKGAAKWLQSMADSAGQFARFKSIYYIYVCDEGPGLLGLDRPEEPLHEPIKVSIPGQVLTTMAPMLRVMSSIMLLAHIAAGPFGLRSLIPKGLPFMKELREMGVEQAKVLQSRINLMGNTSNNTIIIAGGNLGPSGNGNSKNNVALNAQLSQADGSTPQKVIGQSYAALEQVLCPTRKKPPTNDRGETFKSMVGTKFLVVVKNGKYHWVGMQHWPALKKLGYKTQQQWAE